MALKIDNILNLEKSKKAAILAAILLTGAAVYIFLFFRPLYIEYQEKKEKLGTLQLKRSEQELIAKNLPRFRDQVQQLDADLKKALAQLPNKKEISNLLTSISNLGREVGLEFLLFKPLPEVPKDFYAEVPVEIRVLGSYQQVALFFDKVSKLPRIVNISDMTMGEPKEKGGRLILKTFCLAVTFKFLEVREPEDDVKKKKRRREKKGSAKES